MDNNNLNLLNSSLKSLKNCEESLGKLSSSCCMPERSNNMKIVYQTLQNTIYGLKNTNENDDNVHKSIENIAQLGSAVGQLYATCCTVKRESLYQDIFKELNVAHTHLSTVLGVGH